MVIPNGSLNKALPFACALVTLIGLLPQAPSARAAQPAVATLDPSDATRNAMLAGVQRWIAAQTGVSPRQVEIGPIDGRLKVANCRVPLAFDYAFGGREVVRVRCTDPSWDLYVKARVHEARPVLRASRPLSAGTLLEQSDLVVSVGDDSGDGEMADSAAAVGRRLRIPVAAGSTIRGADLEETRRVYRLLASVAAGSSAAPSQWRADDLARSSVPAGALLQKPPPPGSRYARDLPGGRVLAQGDILETRQVLVARENIAAGRPLEKGLFTVGSLNVPDGDRPFISDFAGLEYQTTVRNIPAGEPLLATDLRSAIIVNRGQPVLLTLTLGGGLEISVRAEAIEDGRLSESIRLRNPESGKLLSGRVTGRGTARAL